MMNLQSVGKLVGISTIATGTVVLLGMPSAIAISFGGDPLFSDVATYQTTIAGLNDPTDVYYPVTTQSNLPVALFFQGLNVDKANYSQFATTVARYGFVVVVPQRARTLPPFGSGLFTNTDQIAPTIAHLRQENQQSPIAGKLNPDQVVLLGHSQGGAVLWSAIAEECITPFLCSQPFTRPKEIVGGVAFAAGLRRSQTGTDVVAIDAPGIPVAFIQGDRDSIVQPGSVQSTYDAVPNPPKALITVTGANHYGITNTNNPRGAQPDRTAPTLEQSVATETIARWSALFLRATVLGDANAARYVFGDGDANDPNVTVEAVPEPSSMAGILLAGTAWLKWRTQRKSRHPRC